MQTLRQWLQPQTQNPIFHVVVPVCPSSSTRSRPLLLIPLIFQDWTVMLILIYMLYCDMSFCGIICCVAPAAIKYSMSFERDMIVHDDGSLARGDCSQKHLRVYHICAGHKQDSIVKTESMSIVVKMAQNLLSSWSCRKAYCLLNDLPIWFGLDIHLACKARASSQG